MLRNHSNVRHTHGQHAPRPWRLAGEDSEAGPSRAGLRREGALLVSGTEATGPADARGTRPSAGWSESTAAALAPARRQPPQCGAAGPGPRADGNSSLGACGAVAAERAVRSRLDPSRCLPTPHSPLRIHSSEPPFDSAERAVFWQLDPDPPLPPVRRHTPDSPHPPPPPPLPPPTPATPAPRHFHGGTGEPWPPHSPDPRQATAGSSRGCGRVR